MKTGNQKRGDNTELQAEVNWAQNDLSEQQKSAEQ